MRAFRLSAKTSLDAPCRRDTVVVTISWLISARDTYNGPTMSLCDISHSEQERLHDPEWDIAYRGDETISLCDGLLPRDGTHDGCTSRKEERHFDWVNAEIYVTCVTMECGRVARLACRPTDRLKTTSSSFDRGEGAPRLPCRQ